MPSKKVRAIIFDIGRVIVGVDVPRAMTRPIHRHLAFAREKSGPRSKTIRAGPIWQEGRITPRDWHLHIVRRLGTILTFDQFIRGLEQRPRPNLSRPTRSGRGWRKTIASLCSPTPTRSTSPTWNPTFAFFHFFPVRIYSCVVGASKPSPLVYLEALRASKVQSNEAVYIDDTPENVDAAKALGMAGIHYHCP